MSQPRLTKEQSAQVDKQASGWCCTEEDGTRSILPMNARICDLRDELDDLRKELSEVRKDAVIGRLVRRLCPDAGTGGMQLWRTEKGRWTLVATIPTVPTADTYGLPYKHVQLGEGQTLDQAIQDTSLFLEMGKEIQG